MHYIFKVNTVVSDFHFCSLTFPQDLRKYSPQENEVGVGVNAEVVFWLVNVLLFLLAVVAQLPSCCLSCSTIEDSSPSTPTIYWLAWTVKVPIHPPLPILLLNFTLPDLHLWMRHSQPYSLVMRIWEQEYGELFLSQPHSQALSSRTGREERAW